MSWAAQQWAKEVWTSTRSWSRDGRDKPVARTTDVKLSAGAKLVLSALADRAGKRTHACWPTKERLAADTGLGVHTVQTALKQLVAADLIDRKQRYQNGRRTSDLYTLHIPTAWLSNWEESRGSDSAQIEVETAPKPTQEPTDTYSDPFTLTQQEGSGSDSAPLGGERRCGRCSAHLARDNSGALCSPCDRRLSTLAVAA